MLTVKLNKGIDVLVTFNKEKEPRKFPLLNLYSSKLSPTSVWFYYSVHLLMKLFQKRNEIRIYPIIKILDLI